MRKISFFPHIAAVNIRKNGKFYLPYIVTAAATVAMFYIMCAISFSGGIDTMPGADTLRSILGIGCVVVGFFSALFLLYTNSFLIKRRNKEFGLYNILGMEKKHIAVIMLWETLFTSVISIASGFVLGFVFNKLVALLFCKLLHFSNIIDTGINGKVMIIVAVLFAAVFFLTLISNVIKVYRSSPTELLHASNAGEREPKTKWIWAVFGAICLGSGYAIALIVESPLSAISLFFIAVMLVIIGTYCLFLAGSTAVLKMLRKNKKYYYNVKHFNSVSGMIYRMRQNAVGLANICILSTMVLVMISGTVCMYIGVEDALETRHPTDIQITEQYYSDAGRDFSASIAEDTVKTVNDAGLGAKNFKYINYISFAMVKNGSEFTSNDTNYTSAMGIHMPVILSADEYERLTGDSLSLTGNDVIVYSSAEQLEDSFSIFGHTFNVVKRLDSFPVISDYSAFLVNVHYIVVSDSSIVNRMYEEQKNAYGNNFSPMRCDLNFDIEGGSDEEKIALSEKITEVVNTHMKAVNETLPEAERMTFDIESKQADRDDFYSLYGGFLFLGLVLGILFVMITVLIMYYKQISEGYDDKERFAIMQKVGMSKEEVRRSIRSQVVTVFFLPLVAAVVHIAFAFKVITKLLAVFNLTNIPLFAVTVLATVLIFAVLYAGVYFLTAKTYYKIVE